MKTIIQIILGVVIILLGYLLVDSIMKPINFNRVKNKRYEATIERLKDIRKAQVAYKSRYGRYTGSFDTLIDFVRSDSLKVVKAIGVTPDTLTEKQALEKGIIIRDTTKVSVFDSLFFDGYPLDSLRYVPYVAPAQFQMGAGIIKTESEVDVNVFEAAVHNNVLLKGLDKQLIINLNKKWEDITGFPGLKVGSLEKATNNDGNWK
ncbi:MAG: hypothetical protein ACOC4B_00540 [Bacteroidota bacterium]